MTATKNATPSIPAPVVDAIVTLLNIAPEKVTRESTLADLGADSLDAVEICLELEGELNVALDAAGDEEIFEGGTVGDIVDLLVKKGVKFD